MKTKQDFNHIGLPDSIIELDTTYRNGKRWYKIPNGELYPSVTTVTGWEKRAFFAEWRKNNPEESKLALSRGTSFHTLVEDYLNNDEKFLHGHSSDCMQMFEQFKPLLDEKITNIRAQEVPLYSNTLKLAGRVDCVADYDGELSIIDFKTSKAKKKEEWVEGYFAQATAYAIMWKEMTGETIDNIVILISSMDGSSQEFVKKPVEYVPRLKEMIDGYWKDNIPYNTAV
tara:strand:+ start:305 stop:988 length:684 start_codon:yes stop_codon:yes gene_type:complete